MGECVYESEVGWGVGDWVFGHACGFEEGVDRAHGGEGFGGLGEWVFEVVSYEG